MSEYSIEKTFKKIDVVILLSALLIFSMGVGLLHGGAQKSDSPEHIYNNELLTSLNAGSASSVGRILIEYPYKENEFPAKMYEILKLIMDKDTSSFGRRNKIRLIFKLARYLTVPAYLENKKITPDRIKDIQFKLFEFLKSPLLIRPDIRSQEPMLYLATQGKQDDTIDAFIEWLESGNHPQTTNIQELKNQLDKAEVYAIKQNDLNALKRLLNHEVDMSSDRATHLLQEAVTKNENPAMIPLLIEYGANPNAEYPNSKGITPLIKAVDNKNLALVKQLVEQGAQVNLMVNVEAGSPIQHAVKTRDTDIDAYLRRKGARE